MNGHEVALCAAYEPISAPLLALNQYFKRAMHGGEENIVAFKKLAQPLQPPVGIQNMLKNKIIARACIGGQGSVEAIEKGLSRICPGKFTALNVWQRDSTAYDD